jgi:hypothetical protein
MCVHVRVCVCVCVLVNRPVYQLVVLEAVVAPVLGYCQTC